MGMTFPVSGGGGDFKRVPAGTHLAVCNLVVDLGLQPGSTMYPQPKRQVLIRWEVPGERIEYEKDGQKIEGPLTISRTFTASMNDKANLRAFLEGWRGKRFSDEEAAAFDVGSILGKACLINVTETTKGGNTYSNVASASPLIKGMSAPKAENTLILYSEDDKTHFGDLPPWVQEKIRNRVQGNASDHDEQLASELAHADDDFLL